MSKTEKNEVIFDSNNYRNHDEKNLKLISKSLKECGAGRSILIDAQNQIIAGNATFKQAKAAKIPFKIIETDGKTLIVVKRTDLKTGDKKRKKLALLDNSTSDKVTYDLDNISADFDLEELPDLGLEDVIPLADLGAAEDGREAAETEELLSCPKCGCTAPKGQFKNG